MSCSGFIPQRRRKRPNWCLTPRVSDTSSRRIQASLGTLAQPSVETQRGCDHHPRMAKDIPDPDDFLAFLRTLDRRQRTLLIGIDGRGGSGKSTFARRLERAGDDVAVVEIDDFYRTEHERLARAANGDTEIGGNFDWRRLRDQVLLPLSRDEPGFYQRYDWATDALAEWHTIGIGGI